ncbi:hypothetical protein MASR2M79_16350 [Aminivibrio sp.]
MTAEHLLLGKQGGDRRLPAERTRLDHSRPECLLSGGELDIVALDGNELVVAEVRTRSEGWMQRGEESVGPRKLGRLVRAGRQYVDRRGWQGPWRIDILAVTVGSDGSAALERFEDVTAGAYFS